MTARLVCLYPDPVTDAGYTRGGVHYSAAQAVGLIRDIPFAAISRQHSGMIVASADQGEVARYSGSVYTGAGARREGSRHSHRGPGPGSPNPVCAVTGCLCRGHEHRHGNAQRNRTYHSSLQVPGPESEQ